MNRQTATISWNRYLLDYLVWSTRQPWIHLVQSLFIVNKWQDRLCVLLLVSLDLSLGLDCLLHVRLEMQKVFIAIILNLARLRKLSGVISVGRDHWLRVEIITIDWFLLRASYIPWTFLWLNYKRVIFIIKHLQLDVLWQIIFCLNLLWFRFCT